MTTPTSNSVPSAAPQDLLFNAEKLDEVLNSAAPEFEDRLGVSRLTVSGAISRIVALNSRGNWAATTAYQPRDLVKNSGDWYFCLDAHTSGATFSGDQAAHWRVYQGITAADLEGADGAGLVGFDRTESYPDGSVGAFMAAAEITVQAVGDGSADDTDDIEAAVAEFIAASATRPAVLIFPTRKRYRITRPIDFSATGGKRWGVFGGCGGFELAEILVDFSGYDKDVFRFGSESAPAYQRMICIDGFLFTKANSAHQSPVAINAAGLAQSRIRNIAVGGWDNTVLRSWAPQNCRHDSFTLYGGGRSFLYKSTAGITATQTGNQVDASGNIFSSGDVGKVISFWGPAPNYIRRKAKILTYVNATRVLVDNSYTDSTPLDLYFGSAGITMSAGSAVAVADAPCFVATDVNLWVYIVDAGANGQMLRAKIQAYTSATQVTLSVAATTAVSRAEIAVGAIDIHSDGTAPGQGGSDNSFHNIQVESHQGVGFIGSDLNVLTFSATKLHGQQNPSGKVFALAPMWVQQCSGVFQGAFDAQTLGEYKMRATYQTNCLNFEQLSARVAQSEKILKLGPRSAGFEGGLIQLDDVSLSNVTIGSDITNLIDDDNVSTPGYILTGKISFANAQLTRVHLGNRVHGRADGSVYDVDLPVRRPGDGGQVNAALTSTPAWTGSANPSGTAAYTQSWQRAGRLVTFDIRGVNSVAGSANSGLTIPLPAEFPVPAYGAAVGANDNICYVQGGFGPAETGAPGAMKAMLRRNSAGTGFEIWVSPNSGTVNALAFWTNGSYFTA